ncbi:MAG: phenylalanine--tRNA ligase beta subunit-related protein [Chloroflexota bacterium]|nr:phenylalanine--tRNA ligase beta subunit-related protein [Chloroflexota bacterium]
MFTISETWKSTYPGAVVGILTMRNVINPDHHPTLDARKAEQEGQLRSRFSGQDKAVLKALPTIQAYTAYYKRFKKTYHLLLQLESVALKGKPIPHVAALVEAMFMAELEDLLLTAGHDLELVHMPLTLDVSDGSERFTRINGQEQVLKPGDMFIADAQAVISSVIYGPDRRTRITSETRQVLFSTYAPPGIGEQAVRQHLENIQSNVELVAPEAGVLSLEVFNAG